MSGNYHIHIKEADYVYTTFSSDQGTLAFKRMLFGLCNTPSTFQQIMMEIFYEFLRHFFEVFIDDFAVFSKRHEHVEHLRLTFKNCREANLKKILAKALLVWRMESY
jgi:hypothetical protein